MSSMAVCGPRVPWYRKQFHLILKFCVLTIYYAYIFRIIVLMTRFTVSFSSSSRSRRSSSKSASPPSFSPQRGRGGSLSAKRGGLGRGRARGRGRRSRLSLGNENTTTPENKQPVGKRGGRRSLSSRLGVVAKKKGYLLFLIAINHTQSITLIFGFNHLAKMDQLSSWQLNGTVIAPTWPVKRAFSVAAPNPMPIDICNTDCLSAFGNKLKTHFLQQLIIDEPYPPQCPISGF